jgi:integrase
VFPDKFLRERCLDNQRRPTNKRDEALEYCQRRKNEIARLVERAKAEPTTLMPDDAEALGTALASNVALTLHQRVALPELPTERLIRLKEWQRANEMAPVDVLLENPDKDFYETLDFLNDQWLDQIDRAFEKGLSKSGSRLTDESKATVKLAYTAAFEKWSTKAVEEQKRGAIKAPKPEKPPTLISIEGLCDLSRRKEWHGSSTIPGVQNALNKMMNWVGDEYGIKTLAALQPDHLEEYSSFLYEHQPRSARKDLGYIRSAFECGIKFKVLPKPNPCEGIIRPKRELRQRVAKTLDNKKSMSLEELHRLDAAMAKDPQVDIYWLQRFTGARQQEVAGLRRCDFVFKNGYRCIAIEPHEGRGMGANGQASGLKTANSKRFVPLPEILGSIWEKYQSAGREPCFPKTQKERAWGENYRRRQAENAKKAKVPTGTHALRDTIHQTLIENGVIPDVVMMITGKKLSISDYLHTSIKKMKEAVELYAASMPVYEQIYKN